MRAHYLQHVPFEGLGSIEPWLKEAGYEITVTRFFESAELPEPEAIDLLVVMGGPMSVNDEDEHPWLVAEKAFVRRVVERGTPVLGICLGAQLIAAAMGGKVYPGPEKEIGWHPIRGAAVESGFAFPAAVEVFHWHGETFDLPPGALRLASSAVCDNQAFQLGDATIGLQFHLETTPLSARAIVDHCRDELVPSRHVQSEEQILVAGPERYETINRMMGELLAHLTRRERQ